MSVMAVEYPGYGIYRGKDCSANKIKEDAITVFKYIMNSFKIKEKNVLVFGRSIGTGPACFLAESYQNIKALILQSPYTDISVVAEDNIGIKSNLLQVVMASHFQNIKTIKKIEAPILFIHGKKDLSIPFEHSEILYKKT
jgi:abhydrolase domain-containing protein 17